MLRHTGTEDPTRKELAMHGVQDGVVPQQNLELEVRAPLQQPAQQLAELDRGAVGRSRPALEPRPAVKLPTEDEYGALRREQRSAQRFEIARGVDENGSTRRTCAAASKCRPRSAALRPRSVALARELWKRPGAVSRTALGSSSPLISTTSYSARRVTRRAIVNPTPAPKIGSLLEGFRRTGHGGWGG